MTSLPCSRRFGLRLRPLQGVDRRNRISYSSKEYSEALEGTERAAVCASESEPSMLQLLDAWLARTPVRSVPPPLLLLHEFPRR